MLSSSASSDHNPTAASLSSAKQIKIHILFFLLFYFLLFLGRCSWARSSCSCCDRRTSSSTTAKSHQLLFAGCNDLMHSLSFEFCDQPLCNLRIELRAHRIQDGLEICSAWTLFATKNCHQVGSAILHSHCD